MNVWNKNYDVIKKRHPELLPLNYPETCQNYFLKESKFGIPIPGVIINQKQNVLSSLYKKEEPISLPAGHFCNALLGSMNLLNLEYNFIKSNNILLIEPQLELFLFLIKNFDLEKILNHKNLRIVLGPSIETLQQFIQKSYSPYLDGMLQLYIHKGSSRIFSNEYLPFLSFLNAEKEKWAVEWATQKNFSRNWFRNILHNISNTDSDLPLRIPQKVILLAAGPSVEQFLFSGGLDEKKGDIAAVDTLLPLLADLNIQADWIFSLDCQISSYHHYLKGIPQQSIPIMDISVHNLLTRKTGKVYFTGNSHPLVQYLCPDLPMINTGLGNVTAFAVDALIKMGVEEIEIYGADFSYPRGKAYSRSTYLINHFLHHSNRLQTQEILMYGFSSQSVLKNEGTSRTTARLQNYKKTLQAYIEELQPLLFESRKGYWKIQMAPQKRKSLFSSSIKSRPLEEYRKRLKSINFEDLKDPESLIELDFDDRKCLSTLFPLLSSYFEKSSWQEALEKAVIWALNQLEAIEA